uniref:Sushi domain-containing protein n=1 Tax=Ciona savignyi TaxID=51511 RepID=H2YD50_CIOSA
MVGTNYQCACSRLYTGDNCQTLKRCVVPDGSEMLLAGGGTPLQREYDVNTRLEFSCRNANHIIEGNVYSTCLFTQNWDRPFPTCVAPAGRCPNLVAPQNGAVRYSDNRKPPDTIALFSCDDGYNPIGDRRVLCQVDFQWSGGAPTCQLSGCNVFQAPPGITFPLGIEHAVGALIRVDCTDLFHRLSGGPSSIECLGRNQWSTDLNSYTCGP